MVGDTSTAALEFNDAPTARDILRALGQPEELSWESVAPGRTVQADGVEPAAPLFPRVDAPTAAA